MHVTAALTIVCGAQCTLGVHACVILCFAGQLSRKVREWHLSLSLYKLKAFVTCSITELSMSIGIHNNIDLTISHQFVGVVSISVVEL